ncbi:MAG: ABC transporter permease [Bacteroidales bacterium]|nr:ABC transporter permease [Bacteroidales bacterium]
MKQLRAKFRTFTRFRFIYIAKHLSLILGLVFTLLIISYVYQELNTDRFHSNTDNIHVLVQKNTPLSDWRGTDMPREKNRGKIQSIPGIQQFTSVKKYSNDEIRITHDQHTFQSNCFIVQDNFFDIFDFGLARGNVELFREDPNGVILTKELARKMFGDENPMGKSFEILIENKQLFTVCGVLEEIPVNSSMSFEFIISEDSFKRYPKTGVGFLLISQGFSSDKFREMHKFLIRDKSHFQMDEAILSIIPFKEAYFKGSDYHFSGVLENNGDYHRLRVLAGIAAILFLVSVINYSNLQSTLYSAENTKFSIHRIFGARRKHILWQKISLIFFEYCLQVLAVAFLFHAFTKALVGHNILIEEQYVFYMLFIPAGVLLFYLFTLIYPAIKIFILSKEPVIRNVNVVQGNYGTRRAFVLIQYTFTIALIISSILVYKQYQAMLNKDTGLKTSTVMYTQFFTDAPKSDSREKRMKQKSERKENYQRIQATLRKIPGVKSFSQGAVPFEPNMMPLKPANSEKEYTSQNTLNAYPDYKNILGLKMQEGRFFSEERDRPGLGSVVINEAAKKFWDIDDIEGARIKNKYWPGSLEIIGVVENFNYQHLASKVKPLVFFYFRDLKNTFFIDIEKESMAQTINSIEDLHQSVNPGEIFTYSFLSEDLKAMYKKGKKLGQAYGLLTLIALLISSLGLIALATEDINKRTKEIGIRKVNGAKVPQILILLNTDFLRWVAIAFVIAAPIAWYVMNQWLQNFAYKTDLSWWIFALAGLIAMGIALLTVSWQSWRAARRNPVESLRYE